MRHLLCYLALILTVTRPEITSGDKERYEEEPRTYDNVTETEAKTSEGNIQNFTFQCSFNMKSTKLIVIV